MLQFMYSGLICTGFRSTSLVHVNRLLVPDELITQKLLKSFPLLGKVMCDPDTQGEKRKGVIHLGLTA